MAAYAAFLCALAECRVVSVYESSACMLITHIVHIAGMHLAADSTTILLLHCVQVPMLHCCCKSHAQTQSNNSRQQQQLLPL